MANIVWKKPDGKYSITSVLGDVDLSEHANKLLLNGDVPADWVVFSFGSLPTNALLEREKEKAISRIIKLSESKLEHLDDLMMMVVIRLAKGQNVPKAMIDKIEKQNAIKIARDTAISGINAATTKAEADAVVSAIVWP